MSSFGARSSSRSRYALEKKNKQLDCSRKFWTEIEMTGKRIREDMSVSNHSFSNLQAIHKTK